MLELQRLLKVVRTGEDIFERQGQLYDRVDDNPGMPGYLLKRENRVNAGLRPAKRQLPGYQDLRLSLLVDGGGLN